MKLNELNKHILNIANNVYTKQDDCQTCQRYHLRDNNCPRGETYTENFCSGRIPVLFYMDFPFLNKDEEIVL